MDVSTWVFMQLNYKFDKMSARNTTFLKESTRTEQPLIPYFNLVVVNYPDIYLFKDFEG